MSNATETPAQVTPNAGDDGKVTPVTPTPAAEAQKANETAGTQGKTESAQNPPATPAEISVVRPDDSPLSEEQFAELIEFAKAEGYSQKQTEKLIERQSVEATSLVEEQTKAVEQAHQKWIEQAKNDPEIGGNHFESSAENAKRVVDRFGTDEFKKELNRTGLGNHPELLRIFARIGKSMAEDTFDRAPASGAGKKDLVSIFYPESTNQPKE